MMVGKLFSPFKTGEPTMIDAICIPLPSGLVIEMRARQKGLWSRSGADESYEELWARFQTAVRSEDFASFVKLYGKATPPNVAMARVAE
jgi:hypothetical protein